MSKLYLGSIDLNKIKKEDIVTKDKEGNPFQNGAKYLNVSIWVNDEPDKYGNSLAVKTGGKEASYYIGNAKEYKSNNQPQPDNAVDDDLPF
jgi:hypothetical protein